MPAPLKDIKVLSFGRMLSGPYASMLLSDLGAEVIKIEVPGIGDMSRFAKPDYNGVSSYFLSINRGKKSMTLDLKNEKAIRIVYDLVKKVDILLENFRPGVMDKLGLGYDIIKKHNPKIIYASISGFGQKGPYAQRPAFDMIAQGMGGLLSMTGSPDGPPARAGYSIGDIGASLFASTAILAALHERSVNGEGQWVDISMLDCQVALSENACSRHFATGEIPQPLGSRHPLFTPFEAFPTKDGYIILIIMKEKDWIKFCKVANKTDWINNKKFNSLESRIENYDHFLKEMNKLMHSKSTSQWLRIFEKNELMCSPVNNIKQVVNDPHIRKREMILEVKNAKDDKFKVVGTPMKFSKTPCEIKKTSPELGENNEEILSNMLGMSKEKIQKLRYLKVI
ncbi:MAG: CoA transferase [Desulfobacterales bacterium]|nr:CoA transferase [Desulfobacterales bacterium]